MVAIFDAQMSVARNDIDEIRTFRGMNGLNAVCQDKSYIVLDVVYR